MRPSDVHCTEVIHGYNQTSSPFERREARLSPRRPAKALIERAAHFERRKLTDFCTTALTEAARKTIAEHETLVLSERDRAVFFDTLVNPPTSNERLERAFAERQRRVAR